MLMKILFAIAVLALVAIIVTVGAMWWRLRKHMRGRGPVLRDSVSEMEPEQQHADKN